MYLDLKKNTRKYKRSLASRHSPRQHATRAESAGHCLKANTVIVRLITSVFFSSARKIAAEEDSLKGTGSMFHSLAPVNSMDRIPYTEMYFFFRGKDHHGMPAWC